VEEQARTLYGLYRFVRRRRGRRRRRKKKKKNIFVGAQIVKEFPCFSKPKIYCLAYKRTTIVVISLINI